MRGEFAALACVHLNFCNDDNSKMASVVAPRHVQGSSTVCNAEQLSGLPNRAQPPTPTAAVLIVTFSLCNFSSGCLCAEISFGCTVENYFSIMVMFLAWNSCGSYESSWAIFLATLLAGVCAEHRGYVPWGHDSKWIFHLFPVVMWVTRRMRRVFATTALLQHDAQLDYYGKRLATCSSDRSVKIFDVAGETQTLAADLRG